MYIITPLYHIPMKIYFVSLPSNGKLRLNNWMLGTIQVCESMGHVTATFDADGNRTFGTNIMKMDLSRPVDWDVIIIDKVETKTDLAKEYTKIIKNIQPDAIIIGTENYTKSLGDAVVDALPDIDVFIDGFAEPVMPGILDVAFNSRFDQAPGTLHKYDGIIERKPFEADGLDPFYFPIPAYDSVNMSIYLNSMCEPPGDYKKAKKRVMNVLWMRGKYRATPERAVEQASALRNMYAIDEIIIDDDDFLGSPSWVKVFLKVWNDNSLYRYLGFTAKTISWPADDALLWSLRESGCRRLEIGGNIGVEFNADIIHNIVDELRHNLIPEWDITFKLDDMTTAIDLASFCKHENIKCKTIIPSTIIGDEKLKLLGLQNLIHHDKFDDVISYNIWA